MAHAPGHGACCPTCHRFAVNAGAPSSRQPIKLAYVVARFPNATETFILRELDALAETGEVEIALMSMFPPLEPFTHPRAEPWVARLRRPSICMALSGFGYWLARRPLLLLRSIGVVLRACWRSPNVLVRSLAALPVAAAHARTVRRLGVEHVHAHFATYPTLVAWLCGRLTGTPYSFTTHAHDLFVDQSMLDVKIAHARFVIAISQFNRRFLRDYGGDRMTPVHLIHCGIDPAEYEFRPRSVPGTGSVTALCVGTLRERKGHVVLLDALASGEADLDGLELDVVGDGPLREPLERRAAELGIAGQVRFHGSLTEPQVRDWFARADLFVLASTVAADGQMEGIPIVLIEALASGLPVVATRLSGIPELIVDEETGFLATPGDAASLAEALRRALADSGQLDQGRGRDLVESEFDVHRSARQLLALFRETARAPG
jgi:colanic acid/amylovoran biosynthesis glycosyltransferase